MLVRVSRRGDRVLDSHGAARGHDRGREQRGDVSRSRAECADRHQGRPAARRPARGERAAAGRRTGAADCTAAGEGTAAADCTAAGESTAAADRTAAAESTAAGSAQAEEVGQHAERTQRRDERREPAADSPQIVAELAAAGAIAHVTPCHPIRTAPPVVREDQLLANLRARGVTRLQGLRQPQPRAHQQRLDRGDAHAERASHVRIGHTAKLAHQQGRPLLIGEPAYVRDQASQRLALVGLRDRIVHGRAQQLDHFGRWRRRTAELVDAAVVRDAIEPGPQRQLAVVGPQPRVRADEDVLEGILGVLAVRKHLPRVGEQTLAVAIVDDPEGVFLAGAKQRHELLVGAQAEKSRPNLSPSPGYGCRCGEGGRFHLKPVLTLPVAVPEPSQDSDTITCLISV